LVAAKWAQLRAVEGGISVQHGVNFLVDSLTPVGGVLPFFLIETLNFMATCPPDYTEARRQYRMLKWGTVAAMAVACAVPLSLNLVDPDLWGHIRYGEDWLADGQLHRTATHTFTAVGQPWINHENLAELALALGNRHLGGYGLLAAKCLLGMSILASMVWVAARHGVHPLAAWGCMLLISSNLQAFFPIRPQLLSFALCAVMLVLLDLAFFNWSEHRQVRWRWLWLVPPLFVVWVNSHGGFVAGLCIVGALLGGRMIQLLLSRETRQWKTYWGKTWWGLALVGISCLAATLVNPYGLEMHRWLLASLGSPRPEITEWAAPQMHQPIFWPLVGLIVLNVLCWSTTRLKRDWVQIAILTLVAWQACMHLRHIAFFALLSGFWLPMHVQSALARLRPDASKKLPVITLAPSIQKVAMLALLLAIGLQSFALGRRLTDLPVDRDRYPVDAVQFMVDHHLQGKLVVSFNWAQYAIATMAPQVQVGFDGRFRTCYPQKVVDMHFDFLLGEHEGLRHRSEASGTIDGTRVLEFGSPDLVLIDRSYDQPVQIMQDKSQQDDPEWVLLYRDRVADLWGRSDRYDDPTNPNHFPAALRLQDPRPRDGSVPWPAMPLRGDFSRLEKHRSKNGSH